MQPYELRQEHFSRFPPQAKAFACEYLVVLKQIPLSLLPVLLAEIIEYDWHFPREQRELTRRLAYLKSLKEASLASLMSSFGAVRLSDAISKIDWVNQPQHFSEQLSALLWSTRQIDAYREAAMQLQARLAQALPDEPPPLPRFTLVTVGHGVAETELSLFRRLRARGVLFTAVNDTQGLGTLTSFVSDRARKMPAKYAHWYIDGAQGDGACGAQQGVTAISFNDLAPAALKGLNLTRSFVEGVDTRMTAAPEAAQSFMAALKPEDLDLHERIDDEPLRHFAVKVLTGGAGTQVFSTTFVQWAAREAMRRAQPLTTLVRFAPRQCAAPMNDLLRRNPTGQRMDVEGSLVDADMGAYYIWLNQCRLTGADQARFLAWFENHSTAIAIASSLPQGTTSDVPTNIEKILEWMS